MSPREGLPGRPQRAAVRRWLARGILIAFIGAGPCYLSAPPAPAAPPAAGLAAPAGQQDRGGFWRRRLVLDSLAATLGGAGPALQIQPAGALFGIGDIPAPPDVAAVPADAQTTASGLAFKVLKPPTCTGSDCERPLPYDSVVVDYTGWQVDGKMFDSSVTRGQRASFGVGQVIKGWTEGLQLMAVGEKRRFWIPAALAYGENPGNGRPGGMLVFDVELYEVKRGPKPPPVPPDVSGPPADAALTPSGLAYKVLSPGKPGFESQVPKPDSRVTFEYSGWKTDGELLVSTKMSGKPPTVIVKDLIIKGLSEGLQLMSLGESRRFWVPAKLAYGQNPGNGLPAGMLVFDVKLTGIA